MAIFESTIFERLRKSVGNVTTYTSDGRMVMRKKRADRRDKATEAQLRQRERMRVTENAWFCFSEEIMEGFCAASVKTAFNRFVKANIMSDAVGRGLRETADWLELRVADGPLAAPSMEAEFDGEGREVVFRWSRQPDRPGCVGTDRLFGLVVDLSGSRSVLFELGHRDLSGEKRVALPAGFSGQLLLAYGFAKNAAGTRTSPSVGLASLPAATPPLP